MKKIGFFILFLPVLLAFGSIGNSEDPLLDLRVFKTVLVAHNMNSLDNNQVLILLLVSLFFFALFILAVHQVIRRLIRIGRAYRLFISNRWVEDPDTSWKKGGEIDLNLAMFTEHQWLFNQFLSQGHDDFETHDLLDAPHDWGS